MLSLYSHTRVKGVILVQSHKNRRCHTCTVTQEQKVSYLYSHTRTEGVILVQSHKNRRCHTCTVTQGQKVSSLYSHTRTVMTKRNLLVEEMYF